MKNSFQKAMLFFLSSIVVIQECQIPITSNVNIQNNNKSKFSTKSSDCPIWQVRSFNNDNSQSVSINGQRIFFAHGNGVPVYPYVDSGLIDINQYLRDENNEISFVTVNFHNGSPHSWGYQVYKDGQIVFEDVGGVGNAYDGQTYSRSFTIPNCVNNQPYITDTQYSPYGKDVKYNNLTFSKSSNTDSCQ